MLWSGDVRGASQFLISRFVFLSGCMAVLFPGSVAQRVNVVGAFFPRCVSSNTLKLA